MDCVAPRDPEDRPAPPRPDPLTPPDCDLSSYDWFPLKYRLLQQSEWWLSASDLARSRNIDLWTEAYAQVPAASLPDNDVVLARFAGFGRDVAGFRIVKAELLAPWTLCSDGRWYHPTLAEVASEAWLGRQAAIAEREKDRARKREKRTSGGQAAVSGGHPTDVHWTGGGNPAENALKGKEKTGKGEADASPPVARDRAGEGVALTDPLGDRGWSEVRDLYAETVIRGRGSPMQARSAWLQLGPEDQRALPSAIRRFAQARPWGSNGPPALQKFIADEVWREFASGPPILSVVWNGPAEVRAAVVAETSDAFARSWLDPSTWDPAARTPTLIALNVGAATRLRTLAALKGVAIQDPILPRKQA